METAKKCITGRAGKYKNRLKELLKGELPEVTVFLNEWRNFLLGASFRLKKDVDFEIIEIKKLKNGYRLLVEITPECNESLLISLKGDLAITFNAFVDVVPTNSYENLKIVYIMTERLKENPLELFDECDIDEIYLGITFVGKKLLVKFREKPHLLVVGKTGSGKSRLLWAIITSLMARFSEKEVKFIFMQVAKRDFVQFRESKHCFDDITDFGNMLKRLQELVELAENRENLFTKYAHKNVVDVWDWNSYVKKCKAIGKKTKLRILPIYFLCIDEFYFIGEEVPKSDPEKEIKDKVKNLIIKIGKAARSSGIYILASTQRPTVSNLPSDLRQCMNLVTMAQSSKNESRNAIGEEGAEKLRSREAIINAEGKLIHFRTPDIAPEIIRDLIGEEVLYARAKSKMLKAKKNINDKDLEKKVKLLEKAELDIESEAAVAAVAIEKTECSCKVTAMDKFILMSRGERVEIEKVEKNEITNEIVECLPTEDEDDVDDEDGRDEEDVITYEETLEEECIEGENIGFKKNKVNLYEIERNIKTDSPDEIGPNVETDDMKKFREKSEILLSDLAKSGIYFETDE